MFALRRACLFVRSYVYRSDFWASVCFKREFKTQCLSTLQFSGNNATACLLILPFCGRTDGRLVSFSRPRPLPALPQNPFHQLAARRKLVGSISARKEEEGKKKTSCRSASVCLSAAGGQAGGVKMPARISRQKKTT